jgi:uncharacterized tellurite resistance protein B-like protein
LSNHSFIAYIDEAGDEGFNFSSKNSAGGGSSDWLVLAAAVFVRSTENEDVKVIEKVKELIGVKPQHCLHFRNIRSHEKKKACCQLIGKAKLRSVCVAAHKPSITTSFLKEKSKLYFHMTRFLLERVSWLCRDRYSLTEPYPIKGNGRVALIFDNRTNLSYSELHAYLEHLRESGTQSIDWNTLDTSLMETYTTQQRKGLQVADVLASSAFRALEQDSFGNTEISYLKCIDQRFYRDFRSNRLLGYGIKFHTSESYELGKHIFEFIQ